MPLASPPMIGLDLEDFRRLGVRPHECRSTVIRRAAARSSKALAEKQLTAPSPQVALQLSRVATSAYRLLDPRQRHDAAQRAHVGRILPNTLNWASQTSFHSDSVTKSVDAIFTEGAVGNGELMEMLLLDASPRSMSQESSVTVSLSDNDLLETSLRRSSRERRHRYSWVWLALAGLAAGTLLGLATLQYSDLSPLTEASPIVDPPMMISESASEPVPAQRSLVQDSPRSPTGATEAEPTPATEPERTIEPSNEVNPPGPMIDAAATADVATSDSETDPQAESPSAAPMPSEASITDQASSSPSRRDAEPDVPMKDSAPLAADGFLPDPFLSRSPPDVPPEIVEITNPKMSPINEPDVGPSLDSSPSQAALPATAAGDEAKRHSVPDDAGARDARTQWLLLLPDLAKSVNPGDVEERIAQVEALEGGMTIGSADHWAARMLVAELAWLVEDLDEVRRRLKPLTENYDTPDLQPLAESFIAACDSASLPESQQHLIGNGLPLADQLLMNELPRQCKQVIDAMGRLNLRARPEIDESAEVIASDSLRDYLEDFSQAAGQMQRLRESARRMSSADGEVDHSRDDVGILGRYYCLMLRQWDVGLPWLAEVSDSRIANVARGEIKLDETASPDELIALAQRWVSVASRSRGRASDSMRLHSIEILERVRASTSGLKQLEVERKIDESLQLLPPFLREPTPSLATSFNHSAAAVVQESDNTVAETAEVKSGLSGRITIDGEDIGVQLNYELGVAMTQSILDTIAERLGRTLTRMTIEFDGRVELHEPAKVIVSIAPSPQGLTQDVRIDDVALQFDPQTMTVEVALSEGKHPITWSIGAERIALATLRMRDAVSGQPLSVAQPPASADPTRRTALTVAMVRGSQ